MRPASRLAALLLASCLALAFSTAVADEAPEQKRNSVHLKVWMSPSHMGLSAEYLRLLWWNLAVVGEIQYYPMILGETMVLTPEGEPAQEEDYGGTAFGPQAGLRLYLWKTPGLTGIYLQGHGGIASQHVDSLWGPNCDSWTAHVGGELGFVYHLREGGLAGFGLALFGRLDYRYDKVCPSSRSISRTAGPMIGLGVGYAF